LTDLVDVGTGKRRIHLWIKSSISLSMQSLIHIHLVDCCKRWEKGAPFRLRQEVVNHGIHELTELNDYWERKEKGFPLNLVKQ